MVWFVEDKRTWLQKLCAKVLKNGPVPRHVAIIMDGNRRYARVNKLKQIDGHVSGFNKLAEALNWCFTMDIKEVTVYAFSIENFKRSADEVNGLFDLAREKFQRLLGEKEKIDKLGVCVRIFGDISLVPADLQQTIAKVMRLTKDNNKLFMNVCMAYTSRDEMTMAIKDICVGVKEKQLDISDINETLIENCLYTSHSHEVDLMVRTSGEVRLSDFLLWQSNFSVLSFVDQLWPEFSIWNFYMGIFNYQLNYNAIQKMRLRVEELKKLDEENETSDSFQNQTKRTNNFLYELHSKRSKTIEILATQ